MEEFGWIVFFVWEAAIAIWVWKGKTFQKERKKALMWVAFAFLSPFFLALFLAVLPTKIPFLVRFARLLLMSVALVGAVFPISYTMYFFGPKIGQEKYVVASCIFWYAGVAIQRLTKLIPAFVISFLCAIIYLQNCYFNEFYSKK